MDYNAYRFAFLVKVQRSQHKGGEREGNEVCVGGAPDCFCPTLNTAVKIREVTGPTLDFPSTVLYFTRLASLVRTEDWGLRK